MVVSSTEALVADVSSRRSLVAGRSCIPTYLWESVPQSSQPGTSPRQLLQVRGGQGLEPTLAVGGEPDPHHPLIVVVRETFYQVARCRPIDEFDGAVVLQHQMFGDISDAGRPSMTANGE